MVKVIDKKIPNEKKNLNYLKVFQQSPIHRKVQGVSTRFDRL